MITWSPVYILKGVIMTTESKMLCGVLGLGVAGYIFVTCTLNLIKQWI